MAKMDELTLNAILDAEIGEAVSYVYGNNSKIANDRAKALDYYMGEPFGNERDGRSSVVSTDVQDTVESILPALLKIFFAGDEIVQYQPVKQGDEKFSKQATEYGNYIFTKDNNGFMIFYTWFKDALLQRNGFVMPYWKINKKTVTESYTGLSDNDLALLGQDKTVEIVEASESYQAPIIMPGQPPVMLTDVKIRRHVEEGRVCIETIPPEYVIISRGSKDMESARLSGYRCRKTISELLEEGYSKDDLADVETSDDYVAQSSEEIARWRDEQGYQTGSDSMGVDSEDRSRKQVWVSTLYIRVDWDGDGKAELRRIIRAGGSTGGKILDNEEVDSNDMSSLTPIPMPHKVFGRSVADLVMEIQLIKSTLQRQMLDALYISTDPRHKVRKESGVDLDALINSLPGGVVMMDDLNAVEPLQTSGLPEYAFQMMEYQDSVRETRTGVTRYNQGLDGNSLNKTATGIQAIQSASQQRLELIARIFAETGIIKLFKDILRITIKHQDKARVIRLRDEWVNFDPREWNAEMDVTIAVGLGAGSREAMATHYINLIQAQEKAFPLGIVSPQNVYNANAKLVENMGLKSPEMYFTDPEKKAQQQQGQPPKPDPEMQKLQMQAQLEEKKLGVQVQGKQAELQADMQKHSMKLQTDKEIAAARIQADSMHKQSMAEAAAKPTTNVQFDASGAMEQVAQNLQNMAVEQSQALQAGVQTMAMAAQSIAQAVAMLSAPKIGTLSNGKTITIQTAPLQ